MDSTSTEIPQLWPKCGRVQLTKLEATNDLANMLPTSYWLRGSLMGPLTIGDPIRVLRYARSGREEGEPDEVECMGMFTSSPVVHINRINRCTADIHTQNSIWRVEFLNCDTPTPS